MRCIYSNGASCFARVPLLNNEYKPSDAELKELCNSSKFSDCPRYRAILEIARAGKQ